jgi:maltose/moltooligosaccharide transporter
MEPFRAFVGDMLPAEQRTTGYAVQTIFIGTGALMASAAPRLLGLWAGVSSDAPAGIVPDSVRFAFYIGAVALFAAVLWTVVSTREYSPAQLAAFAGGDPKPTPAISRRFDAARSLLEDLFTMPPVMRRLAVIQFFSWCGLFVLWIFATPVVAMHHFHGAMPGSHAYNAAADHVGVLLSAYNGVAAAYAFALPPLAARFGQERIHAISLLAGAFGLAGFWLRRDARRRHRVGVDPDDALCHPVRRDSLPEVRHLHGSFQFFHRAAAIGRVRRGGLPGEARVCG